MRRQVAEPGDERLNQEWLDAVPDWIWEVDSEGMIRYSNRVVAEILGHATSEVVGTSMFDLLTPDDRPKCRQILERAKEARQPMRNIVGHFEAADGRIVTLELSCVPLLDESGKVIGLRGISRDITEQLLVQRAAEEALDNYKAVLDNSLTGIVIIQNERVVYANPRLLALTGYTPEEARQIDIWQVVHPDDVERVRNYYRQRMAGEKSPEDYRVRLMTKTGDVRHFELRATPVTYRGAPAVLDNLIDITERVRDEERLTKLNECFLSFGPDAIENINRLTAVAGELLEADCALYNRLNRGMLCSWGMWQTPPGYNPVDRPEGHICYDVIRSGGEDVVVVRDLPTSVYANTDPGVRRYGLQTYVGRPVKLGDQFVGSLCCIYQRDFEPTEADKRLLGIIASAVAIEEKRNCVEAELRRRGEEREAVMNAFPDLYFWFDSTGRYVDYHAASQSDLYMRPEEFLGRHLRDVLPPDVAEAAEAAMRQARSTGTVVSVEYALSVGGEERVYESRLSPLPDGRIVAAVRDVTERRRSIQALRESEERYRLLFERSPDMLFVLRGDRFIAINPAVTRMLGYEPDEVIGLTPWDISPEFQPDGLRSIDKARAILADLPSETPRMFEWVHQRKDGVLVECDVSLSAYRIHGEVHVQAIVRDITERKRAEEHRRALERQLEAQKRQFYRETILSVTDGKLDVCEATEIRPYVASAELKLTVEGASDVARSRHAVEDFCRKKGLDGERLDAFMVGVGEAITNAVKHASGGRVYAGKRADSVWVGVADKGPGISSLILPRATLMRGFSTRPSLGLGYTIMLEVADHIMLKTGAHGTTVILVKQLAEPEPTAFPSALPDTWKQIPT